jgi:hypothetical protein
LTLSEEWTKQRLHKELQNEVLTERPMGRPTNGSAMYCMGYQEERRELVNPKR